MFKWFVIRIQIDLYYVWINVSNNFCIRWVLERLIYSFVIGYVKNVFLCIHVYIWKLFNCVSRIDKFKSFWMIVRTNLSVINSYNRHSDLILKRIRENSERYLLEIFISSKSLFLSGKIKISSWGDRKIFFNKIVFVH